MKRWRVDAVFLVDKNDTMNNVHGTDDSSFLILDYKQKWFVLKFI